MTIQYVISERTNGANPFTIFESLATLNTDDLSLLLREMIYSRFIKTAYWFAVSSVAKSRAGMRCQVCNGGFGLQAHHRTYATHGKEHLNMCDLVVLCDNCHGLFHGHKEKSWETEVRKREKSTIKREPKEPLQSVVPDDLIITLTKQLVQQCRTNGTFTNATLKALGVCKSDMHKGWVDRLIGQRLSREKYQEALAGRFVYRGKIPD